MNMLMATDGVTIILQSLVIAELALAVYDGKASKFEMAGLAFVVTSVAVTIGSMLSSYSPRVSADKVIKLRALAFIFQAVSHLHFVTLEGESATRAQLFKESKFTNGGWPTILIVSTGLSAGALLAAI